MKFDWSNFGEAAFNKYKEDCRLDKSYGDDYLGCIRVGNLCFDIVTRMYNNNILTLTYDLYVGGVDTGYSYESNYPYDYEGGDDFIDVLDMSYEEFVSYAEKVMTEYITNHENKYEYASLTEKANEDLKIW